MGDRLERYFLRLGEAQTPDETVSLWAQETGTTSSPETLTLREAAARLGASRRAIVAVPSEHVLLVPVALPVRGRRRQLQALPFVLEEQLLEDVEHLSCVLAEGTEEDGRFAAAACRRERLAAWHALLEECGLGVEALIPDALLLPWQPGTWTVASDGPERVLVRYGRALGGALHPRLLPFYLERLGSEAHEHGRVPSAVVSYGLERPEGGDGFVWEPRSEPWISDTDPHSPHLDLLAGFASDRSRTQTRWRPWRATAVLAAVWLLVLWAHLGLDVLRLGRERRQLERRITTLFHRTFPNERHIVDIRAQMARGLERLEERASSGHWARLLAAAAVARPARLRFVATTYRDGKLELTVTDPSSQDIVRFLHALAADSGVRAKAVGLTTAHGVTRARIVLRERGEP